LSTKKGEKVKLFTTMILVAILVLGAAYLSGAFDAKIDVTINKKVKEDVAELTYDTVEKAQETTDRAFDALKKKLEEKDEYRK
jgi:hypothetical protein